MRTSTCISGSLNRVLPAYRAEGRQRDLTKLEMLAALASIFRYDPERLELTNSYGTEPMAEVQYTPLCEIVLSDAVRELLPSS